MAAPPVYLLSYPRSGSTLVRTCFAALQGRPQLSQYQGDVVVNEAGPLTDALDDLRLVKSHHFLETYRPAIYLVRDGRNAMLSNLFLKYLHGGHTLMRVDEVAAGFVMLSDEDEFWGDHVGAALQLSANGDVCFVRYEDLISDPVAGLRTMLGFVGRTVPDDVLVEGVRRALVSDEYFRRPTSGFTYRAEPGSIYSLIQAHRDGDYWRHVLDASACRYFHERGGTPHLLRFGYETSEDWWDREWLKL